MRTKKMQISIIGLGYVGLPLAVLAAQKGYSVNAIDVNEKKVESIKDKKTPFKDEKLEKELKQVELNATTDMSFLKDSDIILVCVPTPVDHLHNPDLGPVRSACGSIKEHLRPGHLVIIESTINPGVCEDVVRPILEQDGLKAGEDFDIGHCPERINPGDKKWTTGNIPRVVGATSQAGLKKAVAFYESILDATVTPMKSIKAAEATKIIENTFRDINIAYVNELAKSFDKMDIDLVEVIKGASTKPFAFMPHFPGCGIGGHCIPVDPYYLIERAKENGFDHKFLRLAREINNSMPRYTVNRLVKELNRITKPVKGTRIGILGLSYKANVDDTRESPVYEVISRIKELEGKIEIYDPFIPNESTASSLDELLEKSEIIVLATNHDEFVNMDLGKLKKYGIKLVLDGRNCLDKDKIQTMGIHYKGIGR
jgi:UDP-N-acetyl-D-glucosamine dehydrogenase